MKVQQLSQVQISQNTTSGIKEGSVVNGRVLSSNGNGSFTVSLAGQKINVSSQANLIPGQTFQAAINIHDGKVLLKLIQTLPESKTMQFFPADLDSKNPPQTLVNYLNGLGLPADSASMKLLQFLQDSGFKFDSSRLRKILSKNQKAQDKTEKNQLSLLMNEKGIEGDFQPVNAVIYNDQQHNRQKNEENNQPHTDEEAVKDYFKQVSENCNNRNGVLTLFNSLSEGENHWIILPFEWPLQNSNGVIRMLFNKKAKSLNRLIIDCNGNMKKHKIVLNYSNNSVKSVKFSSEPEVSFEKREQLCNMLTAVFQDKLNCSDVKVDYVQYETVEGFAPENYPLTMVRERV